MNLTAPSFRLEMIAVVLKFPFDLTVDRFTLSIGGVDHGTKWVTYVKMVERAQEAGDFHSVIRLPGF